MSQAESVKRKSESSSMKDWLSKNIMVDKKMRGMLTISSILMD